MYRMLVKSTLAKSLIAISLLTLSASTQALNVMSSDGQVKQLQSAISNGEWSLVMLWAHDCVPCERQKPVIDKFYKSYKDRGIKVYGLAIDYLNHKDEVLAKIKRTPTQYPDYFYSGLDFKTDYSNLIGDNFLASPTYLVFDKQGALVNVYPGTLNRKMLEDFFKDKAKVIL